MLPANANSRQALLLSPLIALYGFAPIYLFTEMEWWQGLVSYSALTIAIIVFWLGNIWLFRTHWPSAIKYLVSYTAILLYHLGTILALSTTAFGQLTRSYYFYIVFSAFAINSIILLIVNANRLSSSKLLMEQELGTLKLQHSEAQIKTLLQQLQPHFLFNALSTLKSLIVENPSDAQNYTVRLSEFLRYNIQSSSTDLVPLQEEYDFTRDYLLLQKTRFGPSLQFTVDLPTEWMRRKIPKFALQTLVENAIKHNQFTKPQPLYIRICPENDRIVVINNRSPKALQTPSGTGLANLNKRYQLAFNTSIEILETDEQFTVYLETLMA